MIKKILAGLVALGGFLSTIFIFLFRQSKTEQKVIKAEDKAKAAEQKAQAINAVREAEKAVAKRVKEREAENEELVERMHSGNNLDNFNAGLDLLRKQSESGRKRNAGSSNSGT